MSPEPTGITPVGEGRPLSPGQQAVKRELGLPVGITPLEALTRELGPPAGIPPPDAPEPRDERATLQRVAERRMPHQLVSFQERQSMVLWEHAREQRAICGDHSSIPDRIAWMTRLQENAARDARLAQQAMDRNSFITRTEHQSYAVVTGPQAQGNWGDHPQPSFHMWRSPNEVREFRAKSTLEQIMHDEDSWADDFGAACAICLCEFLTNEFRITTCCNHRFHEHCILRWWGGRTGLQPGRDRCPSCRTHMTTGAPAVNGQDNDDSVWVGIDDWGDMRWNEL